MPASQVAIKGASTSLLPVLPHASLPLLLPTPYRQVRDPTKYADAFPSNPRLEVTQGDVTDIAACKRACSGAGGVIYAASGKGYWSPHAVDYEGVKVGCGRAVLWRDRAGGRTVKAAGFWLWRGLLVAAVCGF